MSELNHQQMFELASRIDEVCGRFEAAWQAGEQPQIENYLPDVIESERADLLRDLLATELELLEKAGKLSDESSYCRRFPQFVEVVREVFSDSSGHAFFGNLRDYELQQKLGAGSMGVVYKALHTRLKRSVAIKTLPPNSMHRPETISRFHREMEAIGQLDDPHIVRAHDAGEVDGTHYLVMEYVDGLDLRVLQERVGPLSIPDACEIVRQAALGLQSAAKAGLVHRDLKPSNLMLTRSGTVKILDLGLAHISKESDESAELTSTGQIMGTFDYLAPEQATDTKNIDVRADIYSLGCTLFKLLTGRVPYARDQPRTSYQRIRAHLEEPIPSIATIRTEIPPELEALLTQMLAKQPAERIQSPKDLEQQLANFSGGHDLPALIAAAGTTTNAEVDTAGASGETFTYASGVVAAENSEAKQPALPVASDVNTLVGRTPRPSKRDRTDGRGVRPTLVAAIALTLLSIVIAYFSGLIFTVKTDGGTIVLECDPAALQDAKIEVNGQEVQLTLTGDNQPVTIGVDQRRGQLRISKAGFKIFQEKFEIALGDNQQAIQVRLEPLQPRTMPQQTDPHRALAEWVIELGGSVDAIRGEEVDRMIAKVQNLPASSFTVQGVHIIDVADFGDPQLVQFAKLCRTAIGISQLDLLGTSVTDAGLQHLRGLEIPRLGIVGRSVSDAGLPALREIRGLTYLSLSSTSVTSEGMKSVVELQGLVFLNLFSTGIDDEALLELRRLRNLRTLVLTLTKVTDAGMESLAAHQNLMVLHLINCEVGDSGMAHVRTLTNLTYLNLQGTKVTDAGLRSLAPLRKLKYLALNFCDVSDTSLSQIGEWFPDLEDELSIQGTKAEDGALRSIGRLRKLKVLRTDRTRITDAGLKHLENLTQLELLHLQNTQVTEAAVQRLHAAIPQCRIEWDGGVIEPK